mmetsp:Transcript_30094/g.71244  ORF Transcript_30094/g.71244 Transcript_30094/m.71244 type:complete len:220 (+) Transcript_30094:1056-1715(+)
MPCFRGSRQWRASSAWTRPARRHTPRRTPTPRARPSTTCRSRTWSRIARRRRRRSLRGVWWIRGGCSRLRSRARASRFWCTERAPRSRVRRSRQSSTRLPPPWSTLSRTATQKLTTRRGPGPRSSAPHTRRPPLRTSPRDPRAPRAQWVTRAPRAPRRRGSGRRSPRRVRRGSRRCWRMATAPRSSGRPPRTLTRRMSTSAGGMSSTAGGSPPRTSLAR